LIAGILAPLCIATPFVSTIAVELFGLHQVVAQLKSLIVTPGLWILIPAIVLNRRASAGSFDAAFYAVQAVELMAGAINLKLMSLNVRDGLRLAGRFKATPPAIEKTQ